MHVQNSYHAANVQASFSLELIVVSVNSFYLCTKILLTHWAGLKQLDWLTYKKNLWIFSEVNRISSKLLL